MFKLLDLYVLFLICWLCGCLTTNVSCSQVSVTALTDMNLLTGTSVANQYTKMIIQSFCTVKFNTSPLCQAHSFISVSTTTPSPLQVSVQSVLRLQPINYRLDSPVSSLAAPLIPSLLPCWKMYECTQGRGVIWTHASRRQALATSIAFDAVFEYSHAL